MAKKSNAKSAPAAEASAKGNDAWPSRFGVLADIIERESAKGPYITFKLDCKGSEASGPFSVYGACFDADIAAQMKASIGKNVWVKGPMDKRPGKDGTERTNFKAIYFKLSEERVAEAA